MTLTDEQRARLAALREGDAERALEAAEAADARELEVRASGGAVGALKAPVLGAMVFFVHEAPLPAPVRFTDTSTLPLFAPPGAVKRSVPLPATSALLTLTVVSFCATVFW